MDKRLNNIGLCMRAGYLVIGEEMVVESLKANKLCYIFLANDAGENTKKKVTDKAKFYQVEVDLSYNTDELSHSIGKSNRKVIGIIKKGESFLKILRK